MLDVANDLKVMPLDRFIRTDSEIAGAVRNALEWDALVPNELIQSTVTDGWVTLEGEVDYWRERNDAERAIRQLAGVVGVINKITIRKQEVNAMTAYPADLRERECLDTRDVYLNQDSFRSS